MKKSMSIYFAEIIPVLLFFAIYVYPDEVFGFSQEYVGKLVIVCIIIFYTSIHVVYGLLACSLVILYYQSDMVKSHTDYTVTAFSMDYVMNTIQDETSDNITLDGLHFFEGNDIMPGVSILSNRLAAEDDLRLSKVPLFPPL